MANPILEIGAIVRAQIPGLKYKRKGTIATFNEEKVCILWEDGPMPKPSTPFLLTPTFDASSEVEDTIAVDQVLPILDFESMEMTEYDVVLCKDFGDQLLKIGDTASAIQFYEFALHQLNQPDLGSTCIVKEKGLTVIAEIDCIDDKSVDICFPETGREASISKTDIILGVSDDPIQCKILLNLTRCLIAMGEITLVASRKPAYIKAAILASSLVYTIDRRTSDEDLQTRSRTITALLLRSKAQLELQRFTHARADAKKVLTVDPNNAEAERLIKNIKQSEAHKQTLDKRLVKDVCKWVNEATTGDKSTVSEDAKVDGRDSGRETRCDELETEEQSFWTMRNLAWIILTIIFAYIIQNMFP